MSVMENHVKIVDVPIEKIHIGERRRQDFGDIAALARGIQRVGLLEPIIVDRNASDRYRLVAGERRLRAAKLLKWKTIPTQLLKHLSQDELRDIEFEENENRKSLTAAERNKTFKASKHLVESSKKAKEVLGLGPKTLKGGRPPKEDVSREAVSKALGVSRRAIDKADHHVALAERYPWLQSDAWRQADVLHLEKALKHIPPEEQGELCQFMERAAQPFDPRPDRVIEYAEVMCLKTTGERAEIYQLFSSGDERERDLARTRALNRPPMPDARTAYIREALQWLQKGVRTPYDQEPEAGDFHAVITRLTELKTTIQVQFEKLKQQEATRVETELRRRTEEIPA
jgi:ParB/RepB/Spo0J family partition protein